MTSKLKSEVHFVGLRGYRLTVPVPQVFSVDPSASCSGSVSHHKIRDPSEYVRYRQEFVVSPKDENQDKLRH